MISGAGGTQGGIARFLIGLAMFFGGGYLLLESIWVGTGFSWGSPLFAWGGFALTSGMVLIPFIFGVGMIFFNAKNPLGWLLTLGSLGALFLGILRSIHFSLQPMSAFELIAILVLIFGGLGLFLSSLRDASSP